MAVRLSDEQVAALLAERKPLPEDFRQRIQTKSKRGHKEREIDLKGIAGSDFRLILRESEFAPLDFSAILTYRPAGTNQVFRLRRYNGKSHEHSNKLEKQTFYDFHIHNATERYQDSGLREDAYAEPTDRYADFHSALRCLMEDCAFETPADPQLSLYNEEV